MSNSKTLHRYDLRNDRDAWLGTVVIADDGYFSAVTDWGNYGYWWHSFGSCFRTFLLDIDSDYFRRKVSPGDEYDGHQTAANVRRLIAKSVRDGRTARSVAGEDFASIWDFDRLDAEHQLYAWWRQAGSDIDPVELSIRRIPYNVERFSVDVLAALQAAIRAELEAERRTA